MHTILADFIRDTPSGREAQSILRRCVHCGFCTATCPTYQVLGDELDGPRGRIYLMKQMLEGHAVTRRTQHHLDRCLTCRACETTCPSGVEYGRLLDIGREIVETRVERPWRERAVRWGLRTVVPHEQRFRALMALARLLRPLVPSSLRREISPRHRAARWPQRSHRRRMLVLRGCVQPVLAPDINAAAARFLDAHDITLVEARGAGCCGALPVHLAASGEGRELMRRNIDAWWPEVEGGVEAIVMTASGCGVLVKDYGRWLADDPLYAERAARVASITRDLVEVIRDEVPASALAPARGDVYRKLAVHTPCTLQHGQGHSGQMESLLGQAGYTIARVSNSHLCCGSAGSYSILQPEISGRLRTDKLRDLTGDAPDAIVTANIGCLHHLDSAATIPVKHWIQLLAPP